ncbi:MAG: hypothetical protein EA368_12400 [Leptolyngbya sp. DLM2.Bin27]|nr:MAG: hypothetical protein EA368_12400 [Leptolyngbya sp. DLM2.Bin27]
MMVLRGLVTEFIDSNFLARQTAELAQVNVELKSAVFRNRATLEDLEKQIIVATDQRLKLTAELESLAGDKAALWREITALRERQKAAVGATSEIEAQLDSRQSDLAKMAAEAADKSQALSGLNRDLNRLTAALTGAETRFSEKHAALLRTYETALGQHRAKLEALGSEAIERANALEAETQNRQNRIAELESQFAELKAQLIAEAEEQIDIARRQFENERQSVLNELEADRLAVHKELTMAQEAVIEKYRPILEAPLLEELRQTQIEVGRVHKKLAEKAGDDLVWNADQIREFLLDIDADGDAPSHLRICGATKSGKSFLVNQIISGGLRSLGFDATFTVVDPYHSQTRWATPPTVKNDPQAAYELILQWAAACDGSPLERPSVLVVDEVDSLIADYGEPLSEAIKKLIKKGRHFNRYFYWLGQNGNCPKKMQWSDVRNFNQIYLGTVADDYAENGLKGRNKNRWLGELEALRDKSKYHAIIHNKGANPYTRLLPRAYFATATTATTAPALMCPKCGSYKVKKVGTANGRQRIKCHDCGKQSYAE